MKRKFNFISFEGIDFSGKTTQIKLLKKQLERAGNKVIVIREPGGTPISERIREILLDRKYSEMTDLCEVLLYSAARHQLVIDSITPELNAGNFVIADRYVDSTTAYQGSGRGLSLKFMGELNKLVTGNLMPYITFQRDENKFYKSLRDVFYRHLIRRKVFLQPYHHGYICYRHTEDELTYTADMIDESLKETKKLM